MAGWWLSGCSWSTRRPCGPPGRRFQLTLHGNLLRERLTWWASTPDEAAADWKQLEMTTERFADILAPADWTEHVQPCPSVLLSVQVWNARCWSRYDLLLLSVCSQWVIVKATKDRRVTCINKPQWGWVRWWQLFIGALEVSPDYGAYKLSCNWYYY